MATDIEANLRSICTPEQMSRIEVVNLDRWVTRFLRKRKYDYSIAFGKDAEPFWQRALDLKSANADLPDAYFREEWQRVIQPQSIETEDQYKRASRIGRGISLSRSRKAAIWPVFEEYRNQLTIHKKKEVDDAYRDAAALLEHERGVPGYVCRRGRGAGCGHPGLSAVEKDRSGGRQRPFYRRRWISAHLRAKPGRAQSMRNQYPWGTRSRPGRPIWKSDPGRTVASWSVLQDEPRLCAEPSIRGLPCPDRRSSSLVRSCLCGHATDASDHRATRSALPPTAVRRRG